MRAGTLRCHDLMQLCRGVLLFLLTDVLPTAQLAVATALFNTLREFSSTTVTIELVDRLEGQTASLCNALERMLPKTEQSLMGHALRHLPEQMRNWGAQNGYWMYPIDRNAAAAAPEPVDESTFTDRSISRAQVARQDGAQA